MKGMRGEPDAVYVITVTGGRKPKVQYELSEKEAKVVFDRLKATAKNGIEVKMRLFQPAALLATNKPEEVFEEEETAAITNLFEEALDINQTNPKEVIEEKHAS